MTDQIPPAVTWALAAALLVTAVLLLRQHGITRRQRRRNAELADGVRAREEELRHLVAVRLPALADHPGRPLPGVGPLDARLAETEFGRGLEEVLTRFSGAVEHARARADQSAKAALRTSMRSLQALANEQQVAISEMQDRHDDPDVLRDLLEIDHTNAQFGRRAQAIAVLCGSWPGRQRATSPLLDVVRGATSRIRDYRRVRVNGQVEIAVESRAVEPVVLALAELLDNAARHSQPGTTVEVTVQAVHNGACVIIDDAGVGMDGQAVERAGHLLGGRHAVDVTRLGDPPRFGFAVIGVLARRYGFTVSVDTRSPYGGVRAVALLPAAFLTQPEPVSPQASADPAPVTAAPAAPAPVTVAPPATVPAVVEGTTEGGLPKRRRRTPRRIADPEPQPSAIEEPPGRSPEENARLMGAFARGTRFGRAAGRILDDDPFHDDPLDDDPLDTPQTTSAENEGTPHT
ncbi:ATP-binding protein [Streptomyces ipomoeae]|uniref:ATP-binding protein n=1 Tax=Streptomyces ipomoeae TaxID=103232 RepID=UPI0011468418|nr:ATP-binding protein [Streptomyces ipomoeae]TQE40278.1 ATP-binding protein [Streptomyces ipomoeae]